jgi:hypothetical protein
VRMSNCQATGPPQGCKSLSFSKLRLGGRVKL